MTLYVLLAAVVALAPGLHAWWSGRALLARVDDPAFPELVLARAQRRTHVTVAAAVVLAFVPHAPWAWGLPVIVGGSLVGGFHFRRTLYGETWHVVNYMRYALFGFVGMAGFWLAVAFVPTYILSLIDSWAPSSPTNTGLAIAVGIAAVLVAWEANYPLVWLKAHRASPLQRPDLLVRFDQIIRRSTVAQRRPQVFRYGAPGGYVMNAIALPSVRQPRVAFGDSLLELLTPDEIVAVFAHEVSHLEHYDRRRMLRIRLITYLLILGGTTLPLFVLASAPSQTWAVRLLWPLVVLVLLALRASKSQAHETESDLRAGALTGDPEAMVRALTKLHHYSRMPRRWPYDFERAASHPSLARRIQALRTVSQAGTPQPVARLGEPTVLRSTEPGAYVALEDARAYWFEGASGDATTAAELREQSTSYRAVAYADLTELRVAVVRGGGRALLARDKTGKTWSFPLHKDDVAHAQRALDVLDIRLATHVRENWKSNARVIAALLALALAASLDFSWPWIPLLVTLAKPTPASVAAMGAMTLARIVFGLLAGGLGAPALTTWPAWLPLIVAFAVGAGSCRLAWRWVHGDERAGSQRSLKVTVLTSLLLLLIGTVGVLNSYGTGDATLFSLGSHTPAAGIGILLLGAGAALVSYRDRTRRRSGIAVAAAAIVMLIATAVSGNPLLARPQNVPPIAWTTAQADVASRFTVSGSPYRIHLSPGGRRVAVQGLARQPEPLDVDESEEPVYLSLFTVSTSEGTARRTIGAYDIAFVDDDRLVVLRPSASSEDSLELALESAERQDSVGLWRRTLPKYFAPVLSLDPSRGVWRVTGYDARTGSQGVAAGRIGGDSLALTRYPAKALGGRPLYTYRDGTSLVGNLHGSFGKRQIFLAMFGFYPFRWDLWRFANGEQREVGTLPGMPECGGAADRDENLLCVVRGKLGLSLWRIAPGDGSRPIPLGALPQSFDVWDVGATGSIAAGARDGNALAMIDPSSGRGTRLTLNGGVQLQSVQNVESPVRSYTMDVGSGPGLVATLVRRGGKSEVTIYRLSTPPIPPR